MERSCTVNLVTLKTNTFIERSCTVNLVTQKQHFYGKELHYKHSYTQTNTFMEMSCTVNLLTQLQTLSWKGVVL